MTKLATLIYLKQNGQTLRLHRNKKAKWNGLGGKIFSARFQYHDEQMLGHEVYFYP